LLVTGPSGGSPQSRTVSVASGPLPLVAKVTASTGQLSPVLLQAHALKGSSIVIASTVRTGFVDKSSRMVRMCLLRSCQAQTCGEHQTCAAGACISEQVDGTSLPVYSGSAERCTSSGCNPSDSTSCPTGKMCVLGQCVTAVSDGDKDGIA